MEQQQSRTLLFYSCHPSDDIICDKIGQFLRPLVREGYVEQWTVHQISPGAETLKERKHALESATCILLLLSAEYLASEMYYQEMLFALEHQKNGIRVIPILVRPFLLEKELEASLPSCLPENGRPVSTWKKREDALFDVAQGICQTLKLPHAIRRRRSSSDRDYLLDQVFASWIEGVLEPSLQGRMPLDVLMQEDPDAVGNPETRVNPWHEEVQELRRVYRPLPPAMSSIQAYDEANGELLILGGPGTGKTTILLELTRLLLKRAEKEVGARVPVIFHLSSWAKDRQALKIWFVEELKEKYNIPRKIGKRWIDNNAILPLLDGLDEVTEPARASCIQAIETYHTEMQRELVVCCRREAYHALPRRLTLQRAISLQQLTESQIEQYLQQAEQSTGLSLQSLRQALRTDSELNELAHQPLMLNIFTLAYQGAGATDLPTKPIDGMKARIVFSDFVEQMLTRRGVPRTGTPEMFRQRLTFIATQLRREQETLLTVEYLQPEWLSGLTRRVYWWSVRLIIGLIGFLLFVLFFVLPTWLTGTILFGDLRQELFLGLIFGLGASLTSKRTYGFPAKNLSWKLLLLGARFERSFNRNAWRAAQQRIRPAEVVNWSWKNGSRAALISGSTFGLGFGLSAWLFSRASLSGLYIGVFGGLYLGVLAGLSSGLYFGITSNRLSERESLSPNQGIWRSGRNGLIGGVFGGLIGEVFVGLPMGILIGQHFGLFAGLVGGLFFGWPVGLLSGMIIGQSVGINAFIQHFVLRFWLWCTKFLPWNLIPFLDEARERLLLRKVGGSFMFIHRAIQDYLADLEIGPLSIEMAKHKQEVVSSVDASSSLTTMSVPQPEGTDLLTSPLASVHLFLPCGHEHLPNAQYCNVCGAPIHHDLL